MIILDAAKLIGAGLATISIAGTGVGIGVGTGRRQIRGQRRQDIASG